MITFSKLERKGHLGNQLFQIASTIGLAKRHGQDYCFKPWKYQFFFKEELPAFQLLDYKAVLETDYHYHDWELKDGHYDIEGWLQTEAYFDTDLTKKLFTFKEAFSNTIKDRYKEVFSKKTILLSIRRGDFVDHPDYHQVNIKFYLNALHSYFPDWTTYNLIVLSDDIAYCKYHFGFLDNAFFGDGLNAIEQLCLGSLCDHFIIGNSTFSWWSAWLGESAESQIIRPIKNFRGAKAKESNDVDYFPERWQAYNDFEDSIVLKANLSIENNAFLSPLTKDYLCHFFDFNSIDFTQGKTQLNLSQDDVVSIYTQNIILPPLAILKAYLLATRDKSHVAYYYHSSIAVNHKASYYKFAQEKDFGIYASIFKSFDKEANGDTLGLTCFVDKNPKETQLIVRQVGKFSRFSGYRYYLNTSKKKYIKALKRVVKSLIGHKN